MIPKPKFLEQLEGFLKKELKTLGVSEVAPNELRLQVHVYIHFVKLVISLLAQFFKCSILNIKRKERELRENMPILSFLHLFIFFQAHREVFEYLIEDFKTYKPLMSAIKNEYEMMLAYQREVIRQLEPLKVGKNRLKQKIQRHWYLAFEMQQPKLQGINIK